MSVSDYKGNILASALVDFSWKITAGFGVEKIGIKDKYLSPTEVMKASTSTERRKATQTA